jgi:homoserine kinase
VVSTVDLLGRRVVVDVPATTANLGAGFDALALALDLGLRVHVEAVGGKRGVGERPAVGGRRVVEVEVIGEGADFLPAARHNRFVTAFERGLHAAGMRGSLRWRVRMENPIPIGRGLGSSAAATVAGLVAADALCGGIDGGRDRLLTMAAELEGHPDNAAAALHGGFVLVVAVDGAPTVVRFEPPPDLRAALYIPERQLATRDMRDVLPVTVSRVDAVHNIGRAALAVAAFATGRLELLGPATDDRLHEPYRAKAFPALPVIAAAAREAGALGACLSGAGSTIIAFCRDEAEAARVGSAMRSAAEGAREVGHVRVVAARSAGATLTA